MLFLRIKQAEVALADRRLDEAFEIARANDLRKQKSGQDLVGRLAKALIERGREHLKSDRPIPASHDCEKAEQLAGNLPEVAELRSHVAAALKAGHEAQQRCTQALAAARRQFERGQVTLAQNILARNSHIGQTNNNEAVMLQDMAENQRAAVEALIARANEALKRDDWQNAIDVVARATPSVAGDMHIRELVNNISELILPRLQDALDHGRLDIAQNLVARLERIAPQSIEIDGIRQTLRQCAAVWTAIDNGKLYQADEMVRRLMAVLPNAKWLSTISANLRKASESLEELRTGPFSLLSEQVTVMVPGRLAHAQPAQPQTPHIPHAPAGHPPRLPMNDNLDGDFTIRVDGVGSYRILRNPRLTIGPLSGSKRCDLAVLADALLPAVTIERDEEDYFLRSPVPIAVNDQPTTGKLLCNGDRIALSSRCRLAFAKPSPASATAMIHLTGARLPKADIRTVILLDREIIVGPGPSSHIRCDEMSDSAILHARDGKLFCQSALGVLVDGVAASPNAAIPQNATITIGPICFSIGKE